MKHLFVALFALLGFSVLSAQELPAKFNAADQPPAPDYSQEKYWLALPFSKDNADFTPKRESKIDDKDKNVDVFYIYPTLYMKGSTWNASLEDKKLNKGLRKKVLKYHASVFNSVGRVYVPQYRQAIIKSFRDTTAEGEKALAFAYEDVKKAFEYYLKNKNQGRPIIIASHSQGTHHARRLLKEYFETPEMKSKLVCAYTIGFGMYPEQYQVLTPCESPTETNCYVTWASFMDGYNPGKTALIGNVCVNPISWKRDTLEAKGLGSVIYNINKKKRFETSAHIKGNMLWVKTKTPFVRKMKNMHVVDYNLFWFDIRRNVELRVKAYLDKK